MVRQIRLSTRCAVTMATGGPLHGLLHGRRDTHVPHALPFGRPPRVDCPWTSIVPSPPVDLSHTMMTYSNAVQCMSRPSQRRYSCIRHWPLPSPAKPVHPLFARPLRRGEWLWHALLHRLESLLSPKIVMAQPHPDVTFDIVSH